MRKNRFPKTAIVRQLERLYDELGQWREVYGRDSRGFPGYTPRWQYEERFRQLGHVQHDLMRVINDLYGLVELS